MPDAIDSARPELVIVGRVRKAHGIRGDLVVEPISDAPDAIFAPGRRVFAGTAAGEPARDGRTLTIASVDPFKGGYIVHFQEIDDRTAAETWRERYLLLPAAELEPLAEDEVYIHELPGMRVVLASGEDVGVVEGTYELPQGLALDVRRPDRPHTVVIPFDRIVTRVDRAARIITIDPPLGLLDD